jgi:hypothetical protein
MFGVGAAAAVVDVGGDVQAQQVVLPLVEQGDGSQQFVVAEDTGDLTAGDVEDALSDRSGADVDQGGGGE